MGKEAFRGPFGPFAAWKSGRKEVEMAAWHEDPVHRSARQLLYELRGHVREDAAVRDDLDEVHRLSCSSEEGVESWPEPLKNSPNPLNNIENTWNNTAKQCQTTMKTTKKHLLKP